MPIEKRVIEKLQRTKFVPNCGSLLKNECRMPIEKRVIEKIHVASKICPQ
jgi:hypothetical protein